MDRLAPGFSSPISFREKKVVLFLSGINLILIQFTMIRNFASILFGTEMIILIVTLSYFLGYSIGYFWSDKLSFPVIQAILTVFLVAHFTLPFSLRYLFGYLLSHNLNLITLLLSVFLCAFFFSGVYSLLLPRFIQEEGNETISQLYRLELCGGLVGIFLMFVSSHFLKGTLFVMIAYLSVFIVIVHLTAKKKLVLVGSIIFLILYVGLYSPMDRSSLSFFHREANGFKKVKSLFSVSSPYQQIEVIETDFGSRHLYLDGVRHFGGDSLSNFNYYISGLPAALISSPTVLIVGSGSFGSLYYALTRAKEVETVEIDKMVVEAGKRFLSPEFNEKKENLLKQKWSLKIDDAKHFLKNSKKKYDLIVMDIAGPLQMQVALLYTKEFYQIVAEKLSEHGMIAVCLNGQFIKKSVVPGRIVKTLSAVYKDIFVIAPYKDSNFAFAGQSLPFKKEDLQREMEKNKMSKTRVLDNVEVHAVLKEKDFKEISQVRMDIVLKRGWDKLIDIYFDSED